MIYLDNSATTPLCEGARNAILENIEKFGNPSSVHSLGVAAKKTVDNPRTEILLSMGIRALNTHRVIFTSGGTESDNLVIFGAISAKSFKAKPRIITTDSEHSAVLAPLAELEAKGTCEVVRISTRGGEISLSELDAALTPNTVLVTLMAVNNETGAIYDVKTAFALAKRKVPGVLTHTDFTQAYLKVRLLASAVGADLITVSGHKINAPKGIGALIVNERVIKEKKLVPTLLGGGQEKGFRSGTENVLGIAAMAGAVSGFRTDDFAAHASALRESFLARLDPRVKVNTPKKFAPHIISLTFDSVLASHMVNALSERGVMVSAGSACSSNGGHKSSALESFGLTPEQAMCTVRVSIGIQNTASEMEEAADHINTVYENLLSVFKK
jgi:cysteine desulfurase